MSNVRLTTMPNGQPALAIKKDSPEGREFAAAMNAQAEQYAFDMQNEPAARFARILSSVKFQNYAFEVCREGKHYFMRATFSAPCNKTGAVEVHHTRKWRLSPHMTKSEIVQTAFKLVLTSIEHEAREQFTYDGAAIFDPHYGVDALVTLVKSGAGQDARP